MVGRTRSFRYTRETPGLVSESLMAELSKLALPDFLYGTAWKEGRTAGLVEQALRAGFRGIDTANQRRHYFEAGVGEGLAAAYRAGIVKREELFLQTKFACRTMQPRVTRRRWRNRWPVRWNILAPSASTALCCTVPLRTTDGRRLTAKCGRR